jgi:hypothetical protein
VPVGVVFQNKHIFENLRFVFETHTCGVPAMSLKYNYVHIIISSLLSNSHR